MRACKTSFMISLLAVPLLTWLLPGGYGQSDVPKSSIGSIQATWDGSLSGTSTFAQLKGNVRVASNDYDLSADDIKLYMMPSSRSGSKPGASSLQRVVAVGGAMPGTQVVAHVRQPLQSTSYTINSDRAVYQPDTSRPSGGTLKFTGNVKVITKSGFLAEPSVTTTGTATILLGAGADYPQVETGAGHLTLTPAQ